MAIDDDLSVFFDPTEFASECILSRPSVPDVVFAGNFGAWAEEGYESHAMATHFALRYATASVDLVHDDRLTVGGVTYRVERSDLVNDGRESVAILFKLSLS